MTLPDVFVDSKYKISMKLAPLGFLTNDVNSRLIDMELTGKWTKLLLEDEVIKIDPITTGPVAPMFKEISVDDIEVLVLANDVRSLITLRITYRYTHPSGSNGYTVYFNYSSETGVWETQG